MKRRTAVLVAKLLLMVDVRIRWGCLELAKTYLTSMWAEGRWWRTGQKTGPPILVMTNVGLFAAADAVEAMKNTPWIA